VTGLESAADASSGTADEALPQRPVLRIVRGNPDAAELAALVALVAAASAGGDTAPAAPRSAWAAPSRSVRTTLPSGGWRSSYAPR